MIMGSKKRGPWRSPIVSAVAAVFFLLLACPTAFSLTRTFPDTTSRIVVFTDQLNTDSMTEAQFQFAAGHYAGSQKLLLAAAQRLREHNPEYLVLHYRLGQGLGYRYPNGCSPTGAYLQIIDTDSWVQEWPNSGLQENWFYHSDSSRVYNCDWGYYLMDISNAAWRTWWSEKVIQQLQNNENDGLFADSYSIPNYLGPNWDPLLPDVEPSFESDWAYREHAFTDYIQGRFAGLYKWIPNIGAWITTRDPSDYSNVDGAMIEDFAEWGSGSYFDPADWELQMNRVLGLTGAGKILIAQTYPTSVAERMFALGSYLLIKGGQSYINLNNPEVNTDMMPEWYPEYGIELGAPVDALPANISAFYNSGTGVYVRHFDNGEVYVNPGDSERTVSLGTPHDKVVPSGGGVVPAGGTAPGTLNKQRVTSIAVPAHGAVVVLNLGAGCTLSCSASGPASGLVGNTLSFSGSATASGCTGTPTYAWSFGDGGSAAGAETTHVYAAAGTFTWTLTVSVAGKTCLQTGTVKISAVATTPVVTSMTKAGSPFRIIVAGMNLQKGIKVYINGALWTNVSWLSKLKIIIKGGAALKVAVPKNTPKDFLFTNPDGFSTTKTWSWH
jgi:PKD repeat protein